MTLCFFFVYFLSLELVCFTFRSENYVHIIIRRRLSFDNNTKFHYLLVYLHSKCSYLILQNQVLSTVYTTVIARRTAVGFWPTKTLLGMGGADVRTCLRSARSQNRLWDRTENVRVDATLHLHFWQFSSSWSWYISYLTSILTSVISVWHFIVMIELDSIVLNYNSNSIHISKMLIFTCCTAWVDSPRRTLKNLYLLSLHSIIRVIS